MLWGDKTSTKLTHVSLKMQKGVPFLFALLIFDLWDRMKSLWWEHELVVLLAEPELHSKNEVSSLCIMHLTSQHFFLKKGKSPLECLHVQEDQEEWVLLEREIFALYCPLQHGLSSCWFTTPNYRNHFSSGEKNIHNNFCHSHGMSNFCAFPFNFPMNKSECMNGITISICDFLSLFSEIEKANVLLAPISMYHG